MQHRHAPNQQAREHAGAMGWSLDDNEMSLLEEDVAGPEASVSLDVIAQPWQQWPEPTYDRLRETDTPLARLAGWAGLSKDAGKDAGLKEVPVRAIKNQSQVCCDCCRGWGLPT